MNCTVRTMQREPLVMTDHKVTSSAGEGKISSSCFWGWRNMPLGTTCVFLFNPPADMIGSAISFQ